MAFVFPGLIILRPGRRGGAPGTAQRVGAWDRTLWALGWVLVTVGLLQAAASIASQFV